MQCDRNRAVLLMNIHVFLDKFTKFTISLGVIRSTKCSIIRYCCKKSSFVCRIIVEQFHGMKLMQCERDRTIFINEYMKSVKFTIPLGVIRSKNRLFDIVVRSLHLYVEL